MKCPCVDRHVPLPQKFMQFTTGGTVYDVCPTTWFNIIDLLSYYKVCGGTPPGSKTKHYSKFVRTVAESMWTDTAILAENE